MYNKPIYNKRFGLFLISANICHTTNFRNFSERPEKKIEDRNQELLRVITYKLKYPELYALYECWKGLIWALDLDRKRFEKLGGDVLELYYKACNLPLHKLSVRRFNAPYNSSQNIMYLTAGLKRILGFLNISDRFDTSYLQNVDHDLIKRQLYLEEMLLGYHGPRVDLQYLDPVSAIYNNTIHYYKSLNKDPDIQNMFWNFDFEDNAYMVVTLILYMRRGLISSRPFYNEGNYEYINDNDFKDLLDMHDEINRESGICVVTFMYRLGYTVIRDNIFKKLVDGAVTKPDDWIRNNIERNVIVSFGHTLCTPLIRARYLYIDKDITTTEICSRSYKLYDTEKLNSLRIHLLQLSVLQTPMICKPNPWVYIKPTEENGKKIAADSSQYVGKSHLRSDITLSYLVHHSDINAHKTNVTPMYIDQVNFVNGIPLQISRDMFNILSANNWTILKYLKDHKLIEWTDTETYTMLFALALFTTNKPFYIPTYLDWRGRLFASTAFLNYQGRSLAKSLLSFYDKYQVNVGGLKGYHIYMANLYGNDKHSISSKIKEFNNMESKIRSIDFDLIYKAKDPLLFLRGVLEYRYIHRNQTTGFMAQFDCTSSGLQQICGILAENEEPNDIDSKLVPMFVKALDQAITRDKALNAEDAKTKSKTKSKRKIILTDSELDVLKDINIDRSLTKRTIMTNVYNATVQGFTDQIIALSDIVDPSKGRKWSERRYHLSHHKDSSIKVILTYDQIRYLAWCFYEACTIAMEPLTELYKYFKDMTKLCIEHNIPIAWAHPMGIQIEQNYTATKKRVVSLALPYRDVRLTCFTIIQGKKNFNKNLIAASPNLIHSLDATYLMNILEIFNKKGKPMLSSHDCFVIRFNDYEPLIKIVSQVFVSLYVDNKFLDYYHKMQIDNIKSCNKHGVSLTTGNDIVLYTKDNGKLVCQKIPKAPKQRNPEIFEIINNIGT